MKQEVLSCETEVLSREPVFHRIGPRVFHRENKFFFANIEQHLNSMFRSCLIANFLLTTNGPRRVVTCTKGSPTVTTGSYSFEV